MTTTVANSCIMMFCLWWNGEKFLAPFQGKMSELLNGNKSPSLGEALRRLGKPMTQHHNIVLYFDEYDQRMFFQRASKL